jgi:guanylate kinase
VIRAQSFPVVISAPSGAGKTSLARALVNRNKDVEFSISATTRPQRAHEEDGRDYFFVNDSEFDRMIKDGELLEWAEVHGRKYGTPKRSIGELLKRGKLPILDIDVQGAWQVRDAFPGAVLVFVLPPSVTELRRRLSGRGSEGSEERRTRLTTARAELDAAAGFDYVVVNDDFETAVSTLQSILTAEKQRLNRFADFAHSVAELRAELASMLERNE